MNKIKSCSLPFILFIFSFLLRLSLISKGPFSIDCLSLAINSQETLATHLFHYQYGFGYPLVVFLCVFFISLGKIFAVHDPIFWVNMMSVVFSSLAIVACYVFTQKLFDSLTAILSSLFLSVFPIHLGLSVFGTSHIPSLFFLLLGLFFLLCYLETKRNPSLFLSGLCIGLMGASRLHEMVLMLLPISYLYFAGYNKETGIMVRCQKGLQPLKSYLVFLFYIFTTNLLFYIPLFAKQQREQYSHQLSIFVENGLIKNFCGFFSFSLIVSVDYLCTAFTFLGLFLALLGLWFVFNQRRKNFWFLLAWFIVPFIFYGNLHSSIYRFLLIPSIPLILALGYALARLIENNTPLIRRCSFIIFLFVIFLAFGTIYPSLQFRHQNDLLTDFAHWISQQTEPNAEIISADEQLFISYFGHRKILQRPLDAFSLYTEKFEEFRKHLNKLIEEKIPVYITDNGLYADNPDFRFARFIQQNFTLQYIDKKLIEDWHQGEIPLRTGWVRLFRLKKMDDPIATR